MSPRSAHRRCCKLLCAGVISWLLSVGLVYGQKERTTAPRQLYVLAATPNEHSSQSYPSNLYKVDSDRRLKLVREVVPREEGVRFVQGWDDAIFVIHPAIEATTVSIVHAEEPSRRDDVVFNPLALNVNNSAAVIAQPKGKPLEQLLPLLTDRRDITHLKGTLAVVLSRPIGPNQQVEHDLWEEYGTLRHEGSTGGPALVSGLIGFAAEKNLAVSVYAHTVVVDSLPPTLHRTSKEIVPHILGASGEYLLLTVQRSKEEMDSPALGNSMTVFVHDRRRDKWRTVQLEGNLSLPRLFGPWLATIVGMWNPDHRPSPGRESERGVSTDNLPNVQEEYAFFGGRWNWKPGILILQNLADDRKIRIETNQEDSEILWVGNNEVLYRVNDTIYQAVIAGNQIQNPVIVVKDDDVPEVHWAFWAQ